MGLKLVGILISLTTLASMAIYYYSETGEDLSVSGLGRITPPPWKCLNDENGTFTRMDATDCTQQPCRFCPNENVTVRSTFTPAQDAKQPFQLITYLAYPTSPSHILRSGFLPGTFTAGMEYSIFGNFTIPPKIAGTTGFFVVQIFDYQKPDFIINRCFNASVTSL